MHDDRHLRARPSDEETAREAVRPYLDMSVADRFAALEALLAEIDTLLGGRMPHVHPDDTELWRYWKDPFRGGPR